MTPKEIRDHRLNWGIDKAFFAILGYLGVRTMNTIDAVALKLDALFTQVQLHEQTIAVLKALNHLTP